MAEPKDNFVYDRLASFPGGMDSGRLPRLLPSGQASFAFNATFRGGFATDRAKVRKINLTYPDPAIQSAFESGLYQGSEPYLSDSKLGSLFASISGRLFQITPDNLGSATVVDQTITTNPNPPGIPQAWLKQAENFLVCNDGNSLPIIFDGNTARRAQSGGVSLTVKNINDGLAIEPAGVAVSTPGSTPQTYGQFAVLTAQSILGSGLATGNTFVVQINSGLFTGPLTTPFVKIGIDLFFVAGTVFISGGPLPHYSQATLQALYDIPAGTTYANGSPLIFSNNYLQTEIGILVQQFTVPGVGAPGTCFLSQPFSGGIGSTILIGTASYTVIAVGESQSNPKIPEIPVGRMLVYGMGRLWISLPDGSSFTASDIVGSSSGTAALAYRDAVLKVTQTQLAAGKPFRVPNSGETIRAMAFVASMDASLGQGPLQIFTDRNVFSCNASVDNTTWANLGSDLGLQSPIVGEALKGAGGIAQDAIVNSNADIIFKSADTQVRSFLLARLDFNKWGNTPISHEMQRVLLGEDVALLNYSSGVEFDNRMLMTCNPIQSDRGVYHNGMVVINFEEISSLAGKSPSVWDGLWTGLNVLSLKKGTFLGVDRLFAFCVNTVTNNIELWEILHDQTAIFDNGNLPVIWGFESADLFRGDKGELTTVFKSIEDGEMSVDDVQGPVSIQVFYKPDQYPGWILWNSWQIKNDMALPNSQPGYFPRMGLGRPDSASCNALNEQQTRFGYTFQIRIVIQGHCRFLGARFSASLQSQPKFAQPVCDLKPTSIQVPALDDFGIYDINSGIITLTTP